MQLCVHSVVGEKRRGKVLKRGTILLVTRRLKGESCKGRPLEDTLPLSAVTARMSLSMQDRVKAKQLSCTQQPG